MAGLASREGAVVAWLSGLACQQAAQRLKVTEDPAAGAAVKVGLLQLVVTALVACR